MFKRLWIFIVDDYFALSTAMSTSWTSIRTPNCPTSCYPRRRKRFQIRGPWFDTDSASAILFHSRCKKSNHGRDLQHFLPFWSIYGWFRVNIIVKRCKTLYSISQLVANGAKGRLFWVLIDLCRLWLLHLCGRLWPPLGIVADSRLVIYTLLHSRLCQTASSSIKFYLD